MSLGRLVWRNVAGNPFRSLAVMLCVAVVAGFCLATTLLVRGSESSLRLGLQRLGADIVVVPDSAEAGFESALLMGATVRATLPAARLAEVARVPGVLAVSPQTYLGQLSGYGAAGKVALNLVAFDPATDFTVQPWLAARQAAPLGVGEAIGGSAVTVDQGANEVLASGYPLALVGRLEPTGTSLDRTLFVSFATAEAMRAALRQADPPLDVPEGAYSAILVKALPDGEYRLLAPRIVQAIPGVLPVESPGMFRALQQQLAGLVQAALAVLALVWALGLALVGLLFAMAVDERRREVAIVRALGSPGHVVLRAFLGEAAVLAGSGGVLGLVLAGSAVYLLRDAVPDRLGLPFVFPSPAEFLGLMFAGIALALLTGTIAAFWPAARASREDPAQAMRE